VCGPQFIRELTHEVTLDLIKRVKGKMRGTVNGDEWEKDTK